MGDCMPVVLWKIYCLDAKLYDVFENIVFQDNKSAIILGKNSKMLSSNYTKDVKTRYYFVTNSIGIGKLSVEWFPTEYMIGDS